MHDDAARREHIRRWVRPDFERFLRPDWERYAHPAGHEAMRRHIAECKAAFEPWQARRLREMRAEQACEEEAALERKFAELRRERVEREQAWEAECAVRKAKADAAWERFMATLTRYLAQQRVARKYSPDQPRVPAGNPDGGQWRARVDRKVVRIGLSSHWHLPRTSRRAAIWRSWKQSPTILMSGRGSRRRGRGRIPTASSRASKAFGFPDMLKRESCMPAHSQAPL